MVRRFVFRFKRISVADPGHSTTVSGAAVGRLLPTVDVSCPVDQLGGQLSGGGIGRPTGAGRPVAAQTVPTNQSVTASTATPVSLREAQIQRKQLNWTDLGTYSRTVLPRNKTGPVGRPVGEPVSDSSVSSKSCCGPSAGRSAAGRSVGPCGLTSPSYVGACAPSGLVQNWYALPAAAGRVGATGSSRSRWPAVTSTTQPVERSGPCSRAR